MEVISFAASLPAFLGISFGSFWLITRVLEKKQIVRPIWLAITGQVLFVVAVRLVLLAMYGAKGAVEKYPLEFGMIGTVVYLLFPLAIGTVAILLVRGATTNRVCQTVAGTVCGIAGFGLAILHQLAPHS